MKAYGTMVDLKPSEKTTVAGQRLIEEHGGLGYSWMGTKTFIKSYSRIAPAKRMYKTKPNGRGIETWTCRQCDAEMDDLLCKNVKPTICKKCIKDNRRLRQKIKRMEKLVCQS